jgi:hypothetical protein
MTAVVLYALRCHFARTSPVKKIIKGHKIIFTSHKIVVKYILEKQIYIKKFNSQLKFQKLSGIVANNVF